MCNSLLRTTDYGLFSVIDSFSTSLAVALDLLTDALILVGQHGVYCQSSRQPGKPAMDLQIILDAINSSKELIGSAMEELKKS